MELKNTIYEMVLGEQLQQELKHNGVVVQIENVFEEGSECDKLYENVYQLNREICKKLHVEEAKEVEALIGNLNEIQYIVAMKMYDYGYQMAKINA